MIPIIKLEYGMEPRNEKACSAYHVHESNSFIAESYNYNVILLFLRRIDLTPHTFSFKI